MDKQDSKTASLREAAQMALDALSLHHTDKEYSEERLQARYALRVALALPDEPVADASAVPGPAGWVDARNWTRADWKAYADANWDMGAPPSAPVERQPLSDRQIYDCMAAIVDEPEPFDVLTSDACAWAEVVAIIRAIELAHGIKDAA